ncbi:MAG: epoxide hydrolase [Anaerolineales bacterium]|nr:epoxide hydrolase [Anaerolineales bacterium]
MLNDLKSRLRSTRWPDQVEGAGWDYGTELSYLQELVHYWLTQFDWRKQERLINELPQFQARVNGLNLHFVYVRGQGPQPLPLVVTHGWPSTFFEMYKIIGPLADPAAYGGDPADAFDVVVPSLPGFGFSERPAQRGSLRVDILWRTLMTEVLDYRRFGAHGSDIGARVTSALGRFHPDVVIGIHIGSVDLDWPEPLPPDAELSAAERDYLERVRRWEKEEGAYAEVQATRPQTLAYGLHDSPVGLAAWIVEKFRAWSDCGGDVESRFTKDELLTTITLYWVTETINASMRRYYEQRHDPNPNPLRLGERIETPTGIAMFPGEKELLVPREWAERSYNIQHWSNPPHGGHFAALEEPELLVADIRAFFRTLR